MRCRCTQGTLSFSVLLDEDNSSDEDDAVWVAAAELNGIVNEVKMMNMKKQYKLLKEAQDDLARELAAKAKEQRQAAKAAKEEELWPPATHTPGEMTSHDGGGAHSGYQGEAVDDSDDEEEEPPPRLQFMAARVARGKEEGDPIPENAVKMAKPDPTKAGSSDVWKYFDIYQTPDGTKYVQCLLCDYSRVKPSCTTNLFHHLTSAKHKTAITGDMAAGLFEGEGGTVDKLEAPAETAAAALKGVRWPSERRDMAHKMYARWICKSARNHRQGETDEPLREFLTFLTGGAYTPPTHQLLDRFLIELAAEGKAAMMKGLAEVLASGISPSLSGDIWSDGTISLFAMVLHTITPDWEIKSWLACAEPFSEARHTGAYACGGASNVPFDARTPARLVLCLAPWPVCVSL